MNLDNGLSIFCDFRIHDNLKFHAFVFHDSLQSYRTDSSISQGHVKKDNSVRTFQVDPQIIRVEDLEFPYWLEIFHMFRRYLGNFKKLNASIVIDEGSTLSVHTRINTIPTVQEKTELWYSTHLDVRLGLVRHLHNKLRICVDHMLQNALINSINK